MVPPLLTVAPTTASSSSSIGPVGSSSGPGSSGSDKGSSSGTPRYNTINTNNYVNQASNYCNANNTSFSNSASQMRNKRPSQREKKAAARRASGVVGAFGGGGGVKGEDMELMIQIENSLLESHLSPARSSTSSSSAMTPTNKRGEISLTHLMNFTFPPRETPVASSTIRKKKSSLHVPFNKEKFINANYRFVLKPAPYKTHLQNPDIPLPWAQILQVIMPYPVHKHPTCPICLTPPTAARVTRCGHSFCFPCILRYLDAGGTGSEYGTCPVCLEYVYSKDVKAVEYLEIEEWGKDYEALMVLMKRGLKMISDLQSEERSYRASGSKLYVELAVQTAAEKRFVEAALALVKHSIEVAQTQSWEVGDDLDLHLVPGYVPPANKGGRKGSKHRATNRSGDVRKASVDGGSSTADEDAVVANGVGVTSPASRGRAVSPERTPRANRKQQLQKNHQQINSRTGQPSVEYFYFYQAQDGQHMYLHPLDVKILKHEFKEYDLFPDVIAGKVLHVQESTMTEDLRKKCRYLSHLPLSCDVNFCELDLSDVVSISTLGVFEKELKHRAQEHSRREEAEPKNSKSIKGKGPADVHASPSLGPLSASPIPDWTMTGQPRRDDEVSSSWEDPSLFDALFPAAVPGATTASTALGGGSGPGVVAPKQRPTSVSSFASAAAKAGSGNLRRGGGSRFATLKQDNTSDNEETREYRYVEEAWAIELEESLLRESEELAIDPAENLNSKGGGGGKKKKRGVMLVSNGGRRGF
ncbi:UNVERIFIED_CONTAM: RING finger protein 10 [Siphonaria sp. JEL0065]|nr:RING finger protein 10 [Siphonaria sp. JEL0065]